jgi:DNA-directed RNA polymerase subunit RPC12/RpoP
MVSPIQPTLRALTRSNMIIDVKCRRCGHRGLFDPGWLIQQFDARQNFKLLPYRCQCGSRDIDPIAYPQDWEFRDR